MVNVTITWTASGPPTIIVCEDLQVVSACLMLQLSENTIQGIPLHRVLDFVAESYVVAETEHPIQ